MRCGLIPLGIALLAMTLVRADPPAPAKVQALLEQLAAKDEGKHLTAEAALLRFGPDLLPLLPKDSKEPRQQAVAALLSTMKASPVRLKKGTALADALTQIEKQTGMKIRDARPDKRSAKLSQDFDQAPFWQVIDALAGEARASVSHYAADGVLELVDRPHAAVPVSYHHAFRTVVKSITLTRDFDNADHHCVIHLETAWEPRLLPFLMEVAPASATFAPDAAGKVLKAEQPGKGQSQTEGKPALEFEVRVPAPRSSPLLDELKGSVVVTTPTTMLDFTFPNLNAPRPASQVRNEVKVTLKQLTVSADRWVITMAIDNPPGTPKFESYQSWLLHNRIVLTNGKQRWHPNAADEELVEKLTAHQAVVEYHFLTRNNPLPKSKPGDWSLDYRTPGRMIEMEVPYRFVKLPLP